LAYGSYAFGMYVLSAKLFGDSVNSKSLRNVSRSTTEASAVTRQTGWKGSKPRVEVKVLPADETGAGAPLPAYADEDGFQKQAPRVKRHDSDSRSDTEDSAPQARLGKREFDSGSAEYSLGDEDKTRKRPSRRRRKTRTQKTETKPEETKPAARPDDAQVSPRATNSDNDRQSDNDTSRRDSSGNNERSDTSNSTSRESSRERDTTRETPKPREKSRRRNASTRPKPRDSSPVPRPEGSRSSGDSAVSSPIPQPE
jgi:hypothetical protein